MSKNYGLNLELERKVQDGTEWQFGSASQAALFTVSLAERVAYLPKGEVQRGAEDTMDCATRGPVNKLEMDFTYGVKNKLFSPENIEWLKVNGYADEEGNVTFSDAFNAIKSGTTEQGNSLKAPIHSMHKDGMIPKAMLPLEPWMSFADYHDPNRITAAMEALGKEFAERFAINYEQVSIENCRELNESEMLVVAGHAWPDPVDGVYPRTGKPLNHAFTLIHPEYLAFDNYHDSFDGDFIKNLAPDYRFYDYAYRIFISSETPDPRRAAWPVDLAQCLWRFFRDILAVLFIRTFGSAHPQQMHVKTLIYTTSKNFWFERYFARAKRVMELSEGVIVDDFAVQYVDPATLRAHTYTDEEGDRKLDHGWFYRTFTAPAAVRGFNNIAFHFTEKERRKWKLERSINGVYWTDRNAYFEFYIIADEGEWSPNDRSDLAQWYRLFLHENGHGFTHFSGKRQFLIEKLGLSHHDNDYRRLPVHYFDYVERDIEKIYPLISFRQWSLMGYVVQLMRCAVDLLLQLEQKQEQLPEIEEPAHKSNRELLLAAAKAHLGTDVTPHDTINDEVACAETVCTITQEVFPDLPMLPYTPDLKRELGRNKHFKATLDLDPGSIIISPTGSGNGSIIGHVGFILENGKIASNNSYTGRFEVNYTIDSWVDRYRIKGGMPIYVFKPV